MLPARGVEVAARQEVAALQKAAARQEVAAAQMIKAWAGGCASAWQIMAAASRQKTCLLSLTGSGAPTGPASTAEAAEPPALPPPGWGWRLPGSWYRRTGGGFRWRASRAKAAFLPSI